MDNHPQHPFDRLKEIITKLRDPNTGCPWDKVQTHESLKPYLIEEAYEVLDAIDQGDGKELSKELGDVLLQIMLHSELASERSEFSATDVVNALIQKLIIRHPHVFQSGANDINTPTDVTEQWERLKAEEREKNNKNTNSDTPKKGALDGVPRALPGLLRAQRVSEKAARLGFEWPTIGGIQEQVLDEVREFVEAAASGNRSNIIDEFGDIFFALVQLARRLDIDAEEALQRSAGKFISRFKIVERTATAPIETLSLDTLQELWVAAKQTLRDEEK